MQSVELGMMPVAYISLAPITGAALLATRLHNNNS
jgi:hypothetical protein